MAHWLLLRTIILTPSEIWWKRCMLWTDPERQWKSVSQQDDGRFYIIVCIQSYYKTNETGHSNVYVKLLWCNNKWKWEIIIKICSAMTFPGFWAVLKYPNRKRSQATSLIPLFLYRPRPTATTFSYQGMAHFQSDLMAYSLHTLVGKSGRGRSREVAVGRSLYKKSGISDLARDLFLLG